MTWWLQPGWKNARCWCGVNIWKAGGDPDMGECPECFDASHARSQPMPEPEYPCDICGGGPAVTGIGPFGVCSQACGIEAEKRTSSPAPAAKDTP